MRKQIYQIIEANKNNEESNKYSIAYDIVMIVVIVVSLLPLLFKETTPFLQVSELVTAIIFVLDYILRWITADLKLNKGKVSFVLYPITPMAIIDLLSILPSFVMLNGAFRLLKIVRLLRALKVFRVFKVVRYSKSIELLLAAFRRQKDNLFLLLWLALGYIIITALVIFSVEPNTFNSFFDALYWAVISLTTIGYGDVTTVTLAGKIITMISAFVGIAIVALPAGMVTAGLMDELNRRREAEKENNKDDFNKN